MKKRINTLTELNQRYNDDNSKFIEGFINDNADILTDALRVKTSYSGNNYSDLIEFLDRYDYFEAYFGGLKIYDIIQKVADYHVWDKILRGVFATLMDYYGVLNCEVNLINDRVFSMLRIYDMLRDIQKQMLNKES